MRKVPESRMEYKTGRNGGNQEKYPYDEWLDGKPTELVRGEDFDLDNSGIEVWNFIVAVRAAARRRGLRITATVDNDDVCVIQSYRE